MGESVSRGVLLRVAVFSSSFYFFLTLTDGRTDGRTEVDGACPLSPVAFENLRDALRTVAKGLLGLADGRTYVDSLFRVFPTRRRVECRVVSQRGGAWRRVAGRGPSMTLQMAVVSWSRVPALHLNLLPRNISAAVV